MVTPASSSLRTLVIQLLLVIHCPTISARSILVDEKVVRVDYNKPSHYAAAEGYGQRLIQSNNLLSDNEVQRLPEDVKQPILPPVPTTEAVKTESVASREAVNGTTKFPGRPNTSEIGNGSDSATEVSGNTSDVGNTRDNVLSSTREVGNGGDIGNDGDSKLSTAKEVDNGGDIGNDGDSEVSSTREVGNGGDKELSTTREGLSPGSVSTEEMGEVKSVTTTTTRVKTVPQGHHNSGNEIEPDPDHVNLNDEAAVEGLYENWSRKHNRTFQRALDRDISLQRLRETLEEIQRHNADGQEAGYRMGLNSYSDWSFDEIRSRLLGYREMNATGEPLLGAAAGGASDGGGGSYYAAAGSAKDWGAEGYVTPVKDQGACASCWAFATTGVLEGAYYRWARKLVSLSEQELIECVGVQVGCRGGEVPATLAYVQRYKGVAASSTYPYASYGASYGSCKSDPYKSVQMKVTYAKVQPTDAALLDAISTYGPITVAIAVEHPFTMYRSGVLDPSACGSTLNHAVLLTGYGVDSATGVPYWKVKNSWGTGWGEQGYVRIRRSSPNACGIASSAVKVLVS